MVWRLAEGLYFEAGDSPSAADTDFLLRELRTPEVLMEAVARFLEAARKMAGRRAAVRAALSGDVEQVRLALRSEEDEARRLDRIWWEPLRQQLEQFRRHVNRHVK